MGLPHIWFSPDVLPPRNWEWNLRHCLFPWDFHQGGQRNSLPNTWGGWRGGHRASTEGLFGAMGTGNVPDLLSRLCAGDLGMSRKSKAFLVCCRASSSVWREPCACGRAGLGEVGSWGSLCGAAPGQHRALNQLQTSWLHCAVGCSQVMLDLVQVLWAGDQHSPLQRGAQSASAAAREGKHEALCLGPPVLGGQGWCTAMCSSNTECRCWFFLGLCGIQDGLGTSQQSFELSSQQLQGWGYVCCRAGVGRSPVLEWLPKMLAWMKKRKESKFDLKTEW